MYVITYEILKYFSEIIGGLLFRVTSTKLLETSNPPLTTTATSKGQESLTTAVVVSTFLAKNIRPLNSGLGYINAV
jgi:hypothetical protein